MSDERWRHDPWAPPPAAQPAPVAPVDDGLDDLRKAELVTMADELGVDSTGTKADIIARLRAL